MPQIELSKGLFTDLRTDSDGGDISNPEFLMRILSKAREHSKMEELLVPSFHQNAE
jgi:hypothetical protein